MAVPSLRFVSKLGPAIALFRDFLPKITTFYHKMMPF